MFAKDFSAFVPFNPVSFDRIAEFGQSLSAQLEEDDPPAVRRRPRLHP